MAKKHIVYDPKEIEEERRLLKKEDIENSLKRIVMKCVNSLHKQDVDVDVFLKEDIDNIPLPVDVYINDKKVVSDMHWDTALTEFIWFSDVVSVIEAGPIRKIIDCDLNP